jgi:hypothetical protein
MQNDLTESVQASIRPGEMCDTYYYGDSNTEKQAYPCVVNTRFVQQFTNLGQGSSQFVISPQGGVSDIVMQFVTPASAGGNYTLLALNQGWGYALINRLSVRYGSSAQYFWTGPQMYLENLLDAENGPKQDNIPALGGSALAGGACGGANAYVYLKLPHNSIRANGKPLPFPSDLLVQPIVVTVELFSLQSIMTNQGGSLATAPTALASAQLQVKQEMLTDSSDQLARRVDMNSHAATFPLMYFAQQETQIQVTSSASSLTQSVNLTGFRAGEVKSVVLWLTPAAGGANTPGSGGYAPLAWSLMNNVTLTYNGEIFSRFDSGSSQLWNLIENEKISAVNTSVQTVGAVSVTPTVSYWTECPFAQVSKDWDRRCKLVHGKPILNAVVNLQFDVPALSTSYLLHAMYIYNASLLCSRGSAEYIF